MPADKLSAVLREFARNMATDFPIQAILDHLVVRIVDVLPISAAGVTLISDGKEPQYVAASNADALRFESLQTKLGEGPCLAACASGQPVLIPDLRVDVRFPKFSPAALAAGLAAAFTFPLYHDEARLGALDLYRDTPGELDVDETESAQILADVTSAYLLNARAREQHQADAAELRLSALHDPLTGLANRLLLKERLEHAANRSRRSHSNAAILFVDLDGFKRVNDLHGHHAGDELLVGVAQRLLALVRPGDTLARLSGDEFVFLLEDVKIRKNVEHLVERINTAFLRPFSIGGTPIGISASVGVAFAGPGVEVTGRMLVEADLAMYRVKRLRAAGPPVLSQQTTEHGITRAQATADFAVAFHKGEFRVDYQPIIDVGRQEITGVEALLRWTHPTLGSVPAQLIVEIAEESFMMKKIGTWVLERACRDRASWLAAHPDRPLILAVNVSASQLGDTEFVAGVFATLAAERMDANALVLEVTESSLITDDARTIGVLTALKQHGIRLALDDFGTGYSSLSHLHKLPIDIVKIDRAFIADAERPSSGRAITAAITELSHVLGLVVVAEGVETQGQRNEVITLGCDLAQGFYYAPAISAYQISEVLAEAAVA